MSLLQLGQVIFGGTPRIIAYLRQHNLLAATMDCTRYISEDAPCTPKKIYACRCPNTPMVERPRDNVSDGVSWYCPQCYTKKSIRKDSFFDKSRLTLQKWMTLLYMWVRQYPVTDACEEAEVGERTAIDIYQWLREVCSQALLNGPPIILGGQQIVVQVDESLFRHKPKVSENVQFRTIDK